MEISNVKPYVLVLMPFNDEFADIYNLGIEPACNVAGARCEKVDEQKFDKNILQQIYDQINKADIIVADMTGKNPNVFYETGYAHALNKSVILLVKNADDIPFDLKHYHHIIYGGKITALKAELETWIRWYIDKPKDSPRKESRLPLIELSPFVIDKQVNRSVPPEWCARSLYLGLTGAQNWLSIANNSNHFYRAGYFKEIVTGLLAEDFLSDIEINAMVSLGPGNGDTDKILCTHLSEKRKIDYVPVDINPFLLTTAISRVGTSACTQFGVVCDFEDELVPFLRDALHANTQGPYLYAMLGYTVGNLDCREGKFFADIKALMNSGDYLLLDYIAIDEEWDYEEYSKTWRSEWDTVMCKFVCDAVAKRINEDSKVLLSQFDTRFSFERGKSDIEGSYATYIKDNDSGLLATNIRRYRGLGNWLRKHFKFEVIKEQIRIEEKHAGKGYILIKKT